MIENTKALIETYYNLFNQKALNDFIELLDEHVAHHINQGPEQIGKSRFRIFMNQMNTCYDEHISDLIIMTHSDGKHASAEFIVTGKYLATDTNLPPAKGQTYRLQCGAFFEVKNSKISRVTNYYNMQDWLNQITE